MARKSEGNRRVRKRMVQRGLKNVVAPETTISLVDGENGQLIYKGYDVKELVSTYSFEEITYLLWHGRLPNEQEQHQFSTLCIPSD